MTIPNTDQFDLAFKELIKAGEEYAGLRKALNAQESRINEHPSGRTPDSVCKMNALRDYLYNQKEKSWCNILAHLVYLEKLIGEENNG